MSDDLDAVLADGFQRTDVQRLDYYGIILRTVESCLSVP
jgi:hypothetical protein